jgi:hypothetical protein
VQLVDLFEADQWSISSGYLVLTLDSGSQCWARSENRSRGNELQLVKG